MIDSKHLLSLAAASAFAFASLGCGEVKLLADSASQVTGDDGDDAVKPAPKKEKKEKSDDSTKKAPKKEKEPEPAPEPDEDEDLDEDDEDGDW